MSEKLKLEMKSDIMFRAFFSRKKNKRFLESFISSVLGEPITIAKVIHDAKLEQLSKEDKYGILDLDVERSNGELINIEMQLEDEKNIEQRTSFYGAKKMSEQLVSAEKYSQLKRVIVIAILNYNFLPTEDYFNETITVLKTHKDIEVNNVLKFFYIELPKFRKSNPDMNNLLNQWLCFIDGERKDLLNMAKKNNKIIIDADEEYNILSGDAEIKRLAEIRLMNKLEEQSALENAENKGREIGKELGKEEGEQIGRKKEKIETAKKLLNLGVEIEKIVKATGLSKEEIQKLE